MVVHRAVTSMEPLDVVVLCEANPDLVLSGGSVEPTFGGLLTLGVADLGVTRPGNRSDAGSLPVRTCRCWTWRTSSVGFSNDAARRRWWSAPVLRGNPSSLGQTV